MNDYLNGAKYFDKVHGKTPSEEIKFYKKFLRRRSRVLDVGCGTGRVSLELARITHACTFDCVDVSGEMLSVFEEKLNALEPSYTYGRSIRLIEADMRAYTSENPYDVILFPFQSIQTLASREEIANCVAQMKTMLHPRGTIIITGWNPAISGDDKCAEKLNGIGFDGDYLYLCVMTNMRLNGHLYSYRETTKVFEKTTSCLRDEVADDFQICSVDCEFIFSLGEKCSLRPTGLYSDFKYSPCDSESKRIVAAFRNEASGQH